MQKILEKGIRHTLNFIGKASGYCKSSYLFTTIMRVSLIHIAVTLAFCSVASAHKFYGQGILNREVSIKCNDVPLRSVLSELEQQTAVKFAYSGNIVNIDDKVTIDLQKTELEKVLDQILRPRNISYSEEEDYIILTQRKARDEEILESVSNNLKKILHEERSVTGTVTDTGGMPVPGVNIMIKGTRKGTITDENGKYTITASDNSILIFSCIGFERQEVPVHNRSVLNIVIQDSAFELQAATINAGYYTVRERESTGSIVKISAKDIEKQPVKNLLSALQANVPGLEITQQSGVPGGNFQVRIRGQNSIASGNDPLYIIDGVPFISTSLAPTNNSTYGVLLNGASPLNSINPADIESIEILKDADATAIYGSRGANGVVLITTKRGKSGKIKVNVNAYSGIGTVSRFMDLLTTEQYLEMRTEAFANAGTIPGASDHDLNGLWDKSRYTDWQKKLIGNTAKNSDVQLSVSGGNDLTQYFIGGSFNKETTVFPGDNSLKRVSTHIRINNVSPDQKFRINASINYSINFSDLISTDLTKDALTLAPLAPPIYNNDGTLNWAPRSSGLASWTNPFAYLNGEYDSRTNNFIGNIDISYRLLPNLIIKTSAGYTNTEMNGVSTMPKSMFDPYYHIYYSYYSSFFQSNNQNWIIEPQLNYELKSFDRRHAINLLAGVTYMNQEFQNISQNAEGFPNEALMKNIGSASSITTQSDYNQYRYQALFGRFNYTYKNRYIINLTGRRDGSSRFGPGKQFANFGAVGAAWIFSEEAFWGNSLNILSFGKLRASYGTSGNDQIGNYRYLDTYSTSANNTYEGKSALNPDRLFNSDYAWEINKKFEVAVELGFIKDRIILQSGYYNNRSSNQLVNYSIAPTTGFNNIISNLPATVQNTGIEIEINSRNIMTNEFSWTTSLNISIPRNKLVDFPKLEENANYNSTHIIGMPLNIRKLYQYTGVDPQTGLYTFLDVDNNGIYNNDDRIIVKDFGRKLFGGVFNSFQFKGFQFDFLFQFVKQDGYIYLPSGSPGYMIQNQPKSVMKRWQEPGDISDIQKFSRSTGASLTAYSRLQSSDRFLTDASFIRFKNFSISYTFSEETSRKLNLQGLSVFIQGQNLFTITNYSGLDPETGTTTLPPLRLITSGIRVTL